VRETEDRHGRRVIATAAFRADISGLDDVYPANAVDLANLVEGAEEVDRVCVFTLWSDELRRNTLFEVNRDVRGLVGGLPGVIGHDPHVVRRWVGWVFKDAWAKFLVSAYPSGRQLDTGYVRITDLLRSCSVPVETVSAISESSIKVSYHILVHTPRLALRGRDRNASLCSIVQQIVPSIEPLEKLGIPPRRNNLDAWLDCVECQFEPNTIVAFLACVSPTATHPQSRISAIMHLPRLRRG
jgi:hypothetical protein